MALSKHIRFYGNYCDSDYKIEEIEHYHSEIEVLIAQEKSKLKGLQIEFEDDPVLYDRKHHFEYTIEQNLRASTIIKLVTFLEIELQNYCCDLQRALNLQVKYSDLKGTIWEQFKVYTTKIALLEIDFTSPNYKKVTQIIQLRNCIVHYNGIIQDFYGRIFNRSEILRELAQEIPSVIITEDDFVFLEKEACTRCIVIIKEFIKMIYLKALERFPDD